MKLKSSIASPVLVLGGGISGLTAASVLQEWQRDYILLERCPTVGGLTRTVEVGEFCFDYTGHFLHLCRHSSPEDIPHAGLHNQDWVQVTRRSCCFVGGKFITAPIQYNLWELPPGLFAACVDSYNSRPAPGGNEDSSFRDYLVSGFGQALSDLFLIPQNEKTMAISLERLSDRAVRRFFPAPDETLVRKGMEAGASLAQSYNSSFWYPRVGGIGRLVDGLRSGLTCCGVNQDVVAVDLGSRTLRTATGETFRWTAMFSSIPLKTLCEISSDSELLSASAQLSHSSTISFNIGLRGPLQPRFDGIHWLYVPDRGIPFYRVGFYSNIGRGTTTPGHGALYVEVGMPPEQVDAAGLVGDLQPRVMNSLEQLGWVDSHDVVCIVMHVMRHAYIHHTPQRDAALDLIFARLRKACVFPIGRYGLWDYISMEDSIDSARNAVTEFLG